MWNKHFKTLLQENTKQNNLKKEPVFSGCLGKNYQLKNKTIINFSSNDYLGIIASGKTKKFLTAGLQRYDNGSGGSHMVCGHHEAHEALISALKRYTGLENVLLFSSGYMANLGALSALIDRHCVVLADKMNHASLNQCLQTSKGENFRYPHQDYRHLKRLLEQHKDKRCIVVTDAVFSMDGTCANLDALLQLLHQYKNSFLYLDDAHGFCVLGEKGNLHAQKMQHNRCLYMANFSKSLGGSGGFLAGSNDVIEYLRQHSKPYIYTTAFSPLQAYVLLRTLEECEKMTSARLALQAKIQCARHWIQEINLPTCNSTTSIQPIVLKDNQKTLHFRQKLLDEGFWVQAIRPPTVPLNTARLRVVITHHHRIDDINNLFRALKKIHDTY